jgi:PIN domain nuclease of toxin-antitoxin system
VSKRGCPLGEDCDLTIAWMKGAEDARDKAKALIEALEDRLNTAAYLLTESMVQLREGKIKTRRNRADIIEQVLKEWRNE